jgi:RNA polymerase sigma factor (sigma-70 family)
VDTTERLLKLLDEHGARLHRLLARLTLRADAAEDLLQDLFLKLRSSGGFQKADDPLGYAIRAAVNLAFDWRRKSSRRPEVALAAEQPAAADDPLVRLEHREEKEQLLAAIAELPEGMRVCLALRYVEQFEVDEVARKLGKSPHQVRALCAKGIARLRQRLSHPGDRT